MKKLYKILCDAHYDLHTFVAHNMKNNECSLDEIKAAQSLLKEIEKQVETFNLYKEIR